MSVPARICTATASDAYGGQTATSTSSRSARLRLSSTQNSAVSAGPLYIFQLPAISTSRLRDCRHSGQFFPFQELEGGTSARRGPIHVVDEPHFRQRPDRIRASDDRVRVRAGNGFGHYLRSLGEARPLEDAHRPVPKDGLRLRDSLREGVAGLGSDVEAEPALWQFVVRDDLALGVFGEW